MRKKNWWGWKALCHLVYYYFGNTSSGMSIVNWGICRPLRGATFLRFFYNILYTMRLLSDKRWNYWSLIERLLTVSINYCQKLLFMRKKSNLRRLVYTSSYRQIPRSIYKGVDSFQISRLNLCLCCVLRKKDRHDRNV